jgi:predicted RNA-binding Zn ribbon-like protein
MDVAELHKQVEYKFAPEPLIAVQALANTYDLDEDEERLLDPDAARRWLIESDLAGEDVGVTAEELQRLVEFRGIVRSLIEANLEADAEPDLDGLRRVTERHPVPMRVGDGGEVSPDLSPADSVDSVIAQMVGIVADAQTRGEWPRLKICASDECRWAFYDSSKNRGGTWCRMEECGNRVKNRRYRERQSARS